MMPASDALMTLVGPPDCAIMQLAFNIEDLKELLTADCTDYTDFFTTKTPRHKELNHELH